MAPLTGLSPRVFGRLVALLRCDGAEMPRRGGGPNSKDDCDEAQEMLAFASFLMRRLDIDDERRKADGSEA